MIRKRETETLAQAFKNDWVEDQHKLRTTISSGVFLGGMVAFVIHGLQSNPALFFDFAVAESPMVWNPDSRKAAKDILQGLKESAAHTINLLRPKIKS